MSDGMPRLDAMHLDVLREIGNIGAGNAASALSGLLGTRVDMKVTRVMSLPFNEIVDFAGGAETPVATVYTRFDGSIAGNILFVIGIDQAMALIRHVTGAVEDDGISEMGFSVLQETGNIVIGSCMTAMSDFLGFELLPSVPTLAVDMAGAILSFSLSEIGRSADEAIMIDAGITPEGASLSGGSGRLFLLPDPESFGRMFAALGVRIDG